MQILLFDKCFVSGSLELEKSENSVAKVESHSSRYSSERATTIPYFFIHISYYAFKSVGYGDNSK